MSKKSKKKNKHLDPRNLVSKMFDHMYKFHDELLKDDWPVAGPEKLSDLRKLCKKAGFIPDEKMPEKMAKRLAKDSLVPFTKEMLEKRKCFFIFRDQDVWEILVSFELIAEDRKSEDRWHRRDLTDRQQGGLRLFTTFFEHLYI